MATLNELADLIVVKTGKSYDHGLKQILKERILQLRALIIRRSVQKRGLDEELKMSVDLELVKVDTLDSCTVTDTCAISRTKNKVPIPIRLSRGVPFDFVGLLDGTPYTFLRFGENKVFSAIPIRKNVRGYYMNNGYVYLTNELQEEFIRIRHVFENVEEATSFCDTQCINDANTDLFIPGDIANDIVTTLISELLNNPKYKELEIPTNNDLRQRASE